MIRILGDAAEAYNITCRPNAAGTRLLSQLGAYGTEYDFARFWLQSDGNRIIALMSRLDGAATVWDTGGADYDEIISFFRAVGCNSLMTENVGLPLTAVESGSVMRFCGFPRKTGAGVNDNPRLQGVYDIMSTSFDVPPFDCWYADMSHRVRHGYAKCYTNGDFSAAAASFADKSALIYGVCTVPDMRGRRFASGLVNHITAELSNAGKGDIFIMINRPELREFYVKLNFADFSRFSTYRLDV
jgi:ribosomal protein S18 acetylase RimI-like enzyme